MGCANSKQRRCSHCNSHYSPVPRCNSMHVLHPPQSKDDSYHVVALTSTTLGSLDETSHYNSNGFIKFTNGNKVRDSDSFKAQNNNLDDDDDDDDVDDEKKKKKNSVDVAEEAKAWSNMIEKKLPKAMIVSRTPTITPPCEPETINTWELMAGLEDTSPLRSPIHFKSFSFDVNNSDHVGVEVDPHRCSIIENGTVSNKPFWLLQDDNGSGLNLKPAVTEISDFDDPQREASSLFHKSLKEAQESLALKGFSFEDCKINGHDDDVTAVMNCKDKVVLYFTSLRGVRKTYEDCCHVRLILKGLGVKVDERDVSMHSVFKEELKELLGNISGRGGLPKVFISRNYIGGAEEIQKLHEDGKLEKLFDCCEKVADNDPPCEACGDIRFVPCETCNGSCKIYYEEDNEEEEEEKEEAENGENGEYGFQRCPDCNENGLIRCPICCY
ncbi:hypothetical protein RIF29_19005 [Crotalaria pallida]|uniref:Glutaredoxin domain-containing protein n=1 Tax=Crotalaria pallida TaxID=3830 RepID=A0AAN9EZZ4_CROPI